MNTRTFLLAACLVPLASCGSEHRYRVYGTDLESRIEPRMFAWPTDDAGGTFRYVLDSGVGETDVREFDPSAVPLDLGGATVVVPPDATHELRTAARRLLQSLSDHNDGLSTHLVVSKVGWKDVASESDLDRRVMEAREQAFEGRPEPTTFGDLILALSPNLVVTPSASGLLLAERARGTELFANDTQFDCKAIGPDDLMARLKTEPSHDRPSRWMVLAVPRDASEATRARCDEFALRVMRDAPADWVLVRRSTALAAESLQSPADLSAALQTLAAEPFETSEPLETAEESTSPTDK